MRGRARQSIALMNMPSPESPTDCPAPAPPPARRRAGESAAHLALKRAAYLWALEQGYRCTAMEVSLPNSSYRADVAAYRPTRRRVPEPDPVGLTTRLVVRDVLGSTAIFECKQARSDFLKDSREHRAVSAELAQLATRRDALERQLKIHYPRLQRGDSLFPEYQTAELEHLEHKPYRRVVRRMEVLHRQLYEQTKFDKIRRQGIANLYYLVTMPGILQVHEVPTGWGLLELVPGELDPGTAPPNEATPAADPLPALALLTQPVFQESRDHQRLGLLQRITQAAMRLTSRDLGYVHPRQRGEVAD